jgi:hypothetical protein
MGGGTFNANDYKSFASSTVGKATEEVYRSRDLSANLNPHGVRVRESRDSDDNPHSTPLIVGIDVTGSMGMIADVLARKGLGTLFTAILDRKPITDPHLMFMALGDAGHDQAPLQVSQFEADNRIVEQLTQIYLEGGGGGNNYESYDLAWYFAAFHTEHDSMVKRGKRGYLFTVGDEEAPQPVTKAQIKRFIGDDLQADLSTRDLLEMVQRTYNVYHIVIEEGNHARMHLPRVKDSWRVLLGQHVISLADHTKLAETIVSAIEVAEGGDAAASAHNWGAGGHIVHDAVKHLPRSGGASRPLLGGPQA